MPDRSAAHGQRPNLFDAIRTESGSSDKGDSDTANLVVTKNLKFEHYFSSVRILI